MILPKFHVLNFKSQFSKYLSSKLGEPINENCKTHSTPEEKSSEK
jgi:hypothetical protein